MKSLIVNLVWLLLAPIGFALAQPAKSAESTDALLRPIGVTKPPFVTAPDFSLRDAGGGFSGLSGHRGK